MTLLPVIGRLYSIGDGPPLRLLWADNNIGWFVIDIEAPNALPALIDSGQIDKHEKRGAIAVVMEDPFAKSHQPAEISSAQAEARDSLWSLIKPLVTNEPGIYIPGARGPLVAERARSAGSNKNRLYGALRKFWQRGKRPDALTPDFHDRGRPQSERQLTGAPLGRPPEFEPVSIAMTDEWKAIIVSNTRQFFREHPYGTLAGALVDLRLKHFTEWVPDYWGRLEPVNVYPQVSKAQFYNWLHNCGDPDILIHVERRRKGKASYDKDHRAKLSSPFVRSPGPTTRVEIDTNTTNFRLRSMRSRASVGRAHLIRVVNSYGGFIHGMEVGLGPPTWVSTSKAIANIFEDKVAYCARFGIDITPDDWPHGFLAEHCCGDGGSEIVGKNAELFVNRYPLSFEQAEAGRGDLKPWVESGWEMTSVRIEPYIPGYIDPERRRPVREHELDFQYDIYGLTQAFIRDALYHNNCHCYEDSEKRPVDMQAALVPANPRKMLEWGLEHRSGSARIYEFREMRLNLLPRMDGQVTESGFKVANRFYTCDLARRRRLFEKARRRSSWLESFAVDPALTDEVYWFVDGQLIPCQLTPAHREWAGLTFFEADQIRYGAKVADGQFCYTKRDGQLKLVHELGRIREEQRQKSDALPPMSLRDRKANGPAAAAADAKALAQAVHPSRTGATPIEESAPSRTISGHRLPPITRLLPRTE